MTANPAITSVILRASRIEQLADTLAAADYKLDSVVKAKLDEASIESEGATQVSEWRSEQPFRRSS